MILRRAIRRIYVRRFGLTPGPAPEVTAGICERASGDRSQQRRLDALNSRNSFVRDFRCIAN